MNSTLGTTHPANPSSYGFYGVLPKQDFAQALVRLPEALKTEDFGILTEIDVQATMKVKLGIDGLQNPTSDCCCLATWLCVKRRKVESWSASWIRSS